MGRMGKDGKDLELINLNCAVEMPKPRVVDPGDVIVKVTGSTVCGSDLHLYHGSSAPSPPPRGSELLQNSC
jgi:threonine dehydrogenase-like Zn-dependent dehydrogenase